MKRFLLIGVFLFLLVPVWAQTGTTSQYLSDELQSFTESSAQNLITIYVIPSKVPYDWSSPHSLYKSYFKNYKRSLFKKDNYLLGHAFIELSTPLSDSLIFTGMRAASREEQKKMVLEEKYGLSILGADVPGKLEISIDLEKKVEWFSKRGELAFMTFLISDQAAERMVEFFRQFKAGPGNGFKPEEHYSGAYWPRYYGEGAGCSAFALSFLQLGGLMRDEFSEWIVQINIPMALIGGPYNPGNKVTMKDIRRTTQWAVGDESQKDSYEPFEIYDPTLIFEWILSSWAQKQVKDLTVIRPVEINRARGILIDAREEPVPEGEGIFMERDKRSVFVNEHPSGLRK